MNINTLNYNYAIPVPSPRPTAQEITANLFSTLDPNAKGYFEKNDLKTLFEVTHSPDSNTLTNDLFTNFDKNNDGKVTTGEMNSLLMQLTFSLDAYAKTAFPTQAAALNPSDASYGAPTEEAGINVKEIDTNDDGKISSGEIDRYFDNARRAVMKQYEYDVSAQFEANAPTDKETQMIDLVTSLQHYNDPTNTLSDAIA